MRASLQALLTVPFAVPFLLRVRIFHQLARAEAAQAEGPALLLRNFDIRRTHAYEDAFTALSHLGPALRHRFRVRIISPTGHAEEGIDGGGLFREFLQLALRAGFNPACGYFKSTSEHRLYPDPDVSVHAPDFERHYRFLGNLLGKALQENQLVELPLCRFFLAKLLGARAGLQDLKSMDDELFRNLLLVMSYPGDVAELNLDFTATGTAVGGHRTFELVPHGQDLAVTNANRVRYVYHVADFHLNRRLHRQTVAFAEGLFELVNPRYLGLFGPDELQKLISGAGVAVDLNDFRRNVVYGRGYSEEHPTVELFWQVVTEMSPTQVQKLLTFVTSCPRPPILGFADLNPKLCIYNAEDVSRLPTASTCMNLLKLPPYTSYETMKLRLLQAIEDCQGFGLS
jgi:ubiquitin-protein ligase E3 C